MTPEERTRLNELLHEYVLEWTWVPELGVWSETNPDGSTSLYGTRDLLTWEGVGVVLCKVLDSNHASAFFEEVRKALALPDDAPHIEVVVEMFDWYGPENVGRAALSAIGVKV